MFMDDRVHVNDQTHGCYLPSDFMYDIENNIWIHLLNNDLSEIGLLPITQATMGKIINIKTKPKGYNIHRGQPLLSVEARRFLGYIYSPLTGIVDEINQDIISEPWRAQITDYKNNWILKLKLQNVNELSLINNSINYEILVKKRGIVCFKIPPDIVYPAIGIECSQLIMTLSDLIDQFPLNSIIHIVADYNSDSEKDLLEWEKISGHKILEIYIEKINTKGLIHVLIQKTH